MLEAELFIADATTAQQLYTQMHPDPSFTPASLRTSVLCLALATMEALLEVGIVADECHHGCHIWLPTFTKLPYFRFVAK